MGDPAGPYATQSVSVFVFLGKGGVGKTTLSLALGCAFRQIDTPVRVVSLDPAHNLKDLASRTRCGPLPALEEVDLDQELETRRQKLGKQFRRRFPLHELLAGVSPEDLVRVLPGMEEEVMLDVLQRVLSPLPKPVRCGCWISPQRVMPFGCFAGSPGTGGGCTPSAGCGSGL